MVHPDNKCYSVLKANELSSHEKTRRKFKCILLSEKSQSEQAAYYRVPNMRNSGRGNTVETLKRWVVGSGEGAGGRAGRAQSIVRAVGLFCPISHWWGHVTTHLLKPRKCTHQEWPQWKPRTLGDGGAPRQVHGSTGAAPGRGADDSAVNPNCGKKVIIIHYFVCCLF